MLDKRYLAGFVDGNGWIGITKHPRSGKRPNPCYKARIQITNINPEIMKKIKKEYGGGFVDNTNGTMWWCPMSSAKRFLRDLIPHLIMKKKRAKKLLEFRQFLENLPSRGPVKSPKWEIEKKEGFYQEMKNMKFGGEWEK